MTDKGQVMVNGDKVRWAMRPSGHEDKILWSTWFDAKVSGGTTVKSHGQGFGNGIELCLMGAIGRARANQNFKQIIDGYYKGIQIVEFK